MNIIESKLSFNIHLLSISFSGNETSGTEVCNHLIAMQTTLDVTLPPEGMSLVFIIQWALYINLINLNAKEIHLNTFSIF